MKCVCTYIETSKGKILSMCGAHEQEFRRRKPVITEFPKDFVLEILTLLDRIELDEDHSLASQRHAIVRKHGMTVVIFEGALN